MSLRSRSREAFHPTSSLNLTHIQPLVTGCWEDWGKKNKTGDSEGLGTLGAQGPCVKRQLWHVRAIGFSLNSPKHYTQEIAAWLFNPSCLGTPRTAMPWEPQALLSQTQGKDLLCLCLWSQTHTGAGVYACFGAGAFSDKVPQTVSLSTGLT